MGRTFRSLLGLSAVIATAVTAFAAPAAAHASTIRSGCNPAFQPFGLIGEFWRTMLAESGVFGCPIQAERAIGNGAKQQFRGGTIVWSPRSGPSAMMSVRRLPAPDRRLVLTWERMGQDWDFFQVRININPQDGNRTRQLKVARQTPWQGGMTIKPGDFMDFGSTTSGHSRQFNKITFAVQGCDRGTFGTDCGPWSENVTYTWFDQQG